MPPIKQVLSFPCQACGVLLAVDSKREESVCGYCGKANFLDSAKMFRLRDHLEALARFESKASHATSEIDYEKRQRRGFLSSILIGIFFNALLIGPIAGVIQLYEQWLLPSLGEFYGKLIAIPLGIGCGLCAIGGWFYFLLYRKTLRKSLTPRQIDQVLCHGCGASIPVWLGQNIRCPFCQSDLLPGQPLTRKAEIIAKAEVAVYESEAQEERKKTLKWQERQTKQGRKIGRVWTYMMGSTAVMAALGTWILEKNLINGRYLIIGSSVLMGVGMTVGAILGWFIESYRERRKDRSSPKD